ncbi:MAG TPA: thiamine-phosphate kinase [Candidatus Methanoperedens sp.]|nr:thiamine-phosphate kinase [Candidatus Methanoperedens sp.]
MPGKRRGNLSQVGEDALVRLFGGRARPGRHGTALLGPGDDAAAVRPPRGADLLLTTDLLAEGVHFRRAWAPPAALGWKLAAVNASDIAAMGGRPLWALLSVALPPDLDAAFAAGVARGLRAAARRFGFALVGGDTCASGAGVFLSLTLIGAAGPRLLTRAGARPGDLLFVTGHLAASALGLEALERHGAGPLPAALRACARRHLRPEPRLAFGAALARAGLATAALDVSDGLARDLARLCAASRVGARVDAGALPILPGTRRAAALLDRDPVHAALHGGEEYELLFAAGARSGARSAALGRRLGVPVARIGAVVPRRAGLTMVTADGAGHRLVPRSWEHFGG